MTFFKSAALALAVSLTGVVTASPVIAETAVEATTNQALPSGEFVRKKKKLKGGWEVVQRGDKTFIVFGDDFRAAGGPDLKVFLSPTSISDVTGRTAVNGSINIGELQSTRGAQDYEVPAGIDLSDYSSVLVHCEEFAVLWGGSDL